jgi:DNA mismatch repair ATPase MutS
MLCEQIDDMTVRGEQQTANIAALREQMVTLARANVQQVDEMVARHAEETRLTRKKLASLQSDIEDLQEEMNDTEYTIAQEYTDQVIRLEQTSRQLSHFAKSNNRKCFMQSTLRN